VQRKNKPDELPGRVSAAAESVVWKLEATAAASDPPDLTDPCFSGPPRGRFT
jgi:hypothetical protein